VHRETERGRRHRLAARQLSEQFQRAAGIAIARSEHHWHAEILALTPPGRLHRQTPEQPQSPPLHRRHFGQGGRSLSRRERGLRGPSLPLRLRSQAGRAGRPVFDDESVPHDLCSTPNLLTP